MRYYVNSGYVASPLEGILSQYSVSHSAQPVYAAAAEAYASAYSHSSLSAKQPAFFLDPQRPQTPFIGSGNEIFPAVQQAFVLTAGQPFPDDIVITVASRDELMQKSLAFLNHSVIGISLNSTREIFVVSGSMAEVILTIGHELGHVLTPSARTSEEEEAKAFAFEAAWAKVIFENNISGLASSINPAVLKPASNGLHDVAFNFVSNNNSNPLELFASISRGEVTQQQVFEGLGLQPAAAYISGRASSTPLYGGYLNKSRVQNLPPLHNFFWSDLGRGVYGMYVPLTTNEFINEILLRKDIEQLHRTLGHEYSLHHVMGLPDGYAVEALEEAMFWTADEQDRYSKQKE